LAEPERQLNEDVCSDIMHHLQGLQVTVRDYFPPKVEIFCGYEIPLHSLPEQGLTTKQLEELIDI
jgi:hypothetical protein